MSIDKSGNIKLYVDVQFAVHKDMMRHTCGFMTMGTVVAYVQFRKQKMNTKSSTKAKLVRVYDILTQVIWT